MDCLKTILGSLLLVGVLYNGAARADRQAVVRIPDHHWPPYFTQSDEFSHHQGYAMDKIRYCLADMNVKVKRVPSSIKRTEYLLRRGSVDLWVMSNRDGREEWLEFGRIPVFEDGYAIFRATFSLLRFKKLEDLNGLRVGTLLGLKISDGFQNWQKKMRPSQRAKEYSNVEGLLQKLINGQLDAAVTSIGPFYATAIDENVLDEITMVGRPLRQQGYFVVLSKKADHIKDKRAFLKKIDACLAAPENQALMKSLKTSYFGN